MPEPKVLYNTLGMTVNRAKLLRLLFFKDSKISEYMPESLANDPKYRYLVPEDIEEVMTWNNKMVDAIIKAMKEVSEFPFDDIVTCPWCIQRSVCIDCNYGKRHGKCSLSVKDGNTYGKLITSLSVHALCELPGMIKGIKDILKSKKRRS